jgi:hypothetical protein
MTEFSQDDQPQATPGTAGAIAPAPVELRIGVGALLARLADDETAA